jgi:hypothetical protein
MSDLCTEPQGAVLWGGSFSIDRLCAAQSYANLWDSIDWLVEEVPIIIDYQAHTSSSTCRKERPLRSDMPQGVTISCEKLCTHSVAFAGLGQRGAIVV